MAFKYCTATNTGKGFITHEDSRNFYISGKPGDVWVLENNNNAAIWIADKATEKTKSEAQAIVDAEIASAQAAWDALPDEEKAPAVPTNSRPSDITLP
jgi:hypothetical protein